MDTTVNNSAEEGVLDARPTVHTEVKPACTDCAPQWPEPTQPASGALANLRSARRWKSSLYDTTIWFLFGLLVTTMLKMYLPGYPVIVGSPSIPEGFYWVDKTDRNFQPGDYVSFDFKPAQTWLEGRYGREPVHTKMVLGVAGDVVRADQDLNLTLCHPAHDGVAQNCVPAGHVFLSDSLGRPLYSWVPAGHQYTLRQGEIWVYGTHPKSLDSRYHGPIPAAATNGKASPVWQFSHQIWD
ncbi:hypothetical protein G3A43_06765 [Paraburkholderia aspalathi]|nr:hypothetical protein [Paraburkholderia aspalathi]